MLQETRRRLRALIMAVLIFVISLLLVKFILTFLNADKSHPFVVLFYLLTQPLSFLFENIKVFGVEIGALVAIVFYLFLGYLASLLVNSLLRETPEEKILGVINVIFKIIEAVIASRIIFIFLAVVPESPFTSLVYWSTVWARGVTPTVDSILGSIEISTIVVLIIIIILDVGTEAGFRVFQFAIGSKKPGDPLLEPVSTPTDTPEKPITFETQTLAAAPPTLTPMPPPPVPPSITVNVPPPTVIHNSPNSSMANQQSSK